MDAGHAVADGRLRNDSVGVARKAVRRTRINQTGIGPQGLGGNTTALAVHIESAWTHITCNPVAVNMQCWRAERRRAKLWPDGRVEFGF